MKRVKAKISREPKPSHYFRKRFVWFANSVFELGPKYGCDRVTQYSPISGDVLLHVPVKGKESSNCVFVPSLGKWLATERGVCRYKNFALRFNMLDISVYYVLSAEDPDNYQLDIRVHTPLEAAEVLGFYFDAKRNCESRGKRSTVSLTYLIQHYYVRVWVRDKPMLLPLDDRRLFDRIPADLVNYMAASVPGKGSTPAEAWAECCWRCRSKLLELPLEELWHSDLCLETPPPRAVGFAELNSKARSLHGWSPTWVIRIRRRRASAFFCREFFGHTTEGLNALKSALGDWTSLDHLAGKLATTKIQVPQSRVAQVRWAIESSATRDELLAQFEKAVDAPVPFAVAPAAIRRAPGSVLAVRPGAGRIKRD